MAIGQKYVIVANAHIHANIRIKAKKEAKAKLRSQIKPIEPKDRKVSA